MKVVVHKSASTGAWLEVGGFYIVDLVSDYGPNDAPDIKSRLVAALAPDIAALKADRDQGKDNYGRVHCDWLTAHCKAFALWEENAALQAKVARLEDELERTAEERDTWRDVSEEYVTAANEAVDAWAAAGIKANEQMLKAGDEAFRRVQAKLRDHGLLP